MSTPNRKHVFYTKVNSQSVNKNQIDTNVYIHILQLRNMGKCTCSNCKYHSIYN